MTKKHIEAPTPPAASMTTLLKHNKIAVEALCSYLKIHADTSTTAVAKDRGRWMETVAQNLQRHDAEKILLAIDMTKPGRPLKFEESFEQRLF